MKGGLCHACGAWVPIVYHEVIGRSGLAYHRESGRVAAGRDLPADGALCVGSCSVVFPCSAGPVGVLPEGS